MAPSPDSSADRQLLFGVLCVQCGLVQPAQLVQAASAWAADRQRSVADHMESMGLLKPADRARIEQVVELAVQAHGGDARHSLASFGGEAAVFASFGGSVSLAAGGQVTVSGAAGRAAAPAAVAGCDLDSAEGVALETPGRYRYMDSRLLVEHSQSRFTDDPRTAELGRGGMGRVLVAYDHYLGRNVAVKELLPAAADSQSPTGPASPMASSAQMIARFLREARVTGQLEHPAIVPVYELGRRPDGTLYYAMKLVRGKNLRAAIKGCASAAERLLLLSHVRDLCYAIAYAHSRGVINRDIKPDNIMVGEFGETLVLDWGLAKVVGKEDVRGQEILREIEQIDAAAQGQTVAEFLGTPNYMPPEQAWGRLEEVDQRSDIWSIGAVLYELLTGRPPFTGVNVFEVVGKVRSESVAPVGSAESSVPPELAAIAMRCLQRSPDDRYQNAREVAEEIGRFQSGSRVTAYQYSSWELLARFVAMNRGLTAAVTAAVVVLIAATVMVTVNYRRALESEAAAISSGEQAVVARRQAEENETAARASEARARHSEEEARTSEQRARTNEQAALAAGERAARSEAEALTGLAAAYFEKAGSAARAGHHDEELALLASSLANHDRPESRGALLAALSPPPPRPLWSAAAARKITSLAFSPDGSRLSAAAGQSFVRTWRLPEGLELENRSCGDQRMDHLLVAFSPDGVRQLAAGAGSQACAWPTGGGERLWEWGQAPWGTIAIDEAADGGAVLLASAGRMALWQSAPQRSREIGLNTVHRGDLRCAALSPDGLLAASGDVGGGLALHDLSGPGEVRSETVSELVGVMAVAFTGNRELAVVTSEGRLALFGVDSRAVAYEFGVDPGAGRVAGAAFSPLRGWAAMAFGDGEVILFELRQRREFARFRATIGVLALAVAEGGRQVALAGGDRSLALYETETGRTALQLGTAPGLPWTVVPQPKDRELPRELPVDLGSRGRLAFSADGRLLALSVADGLEEVRKADDGALQSRFLWTGMEIDRLLFEEQHLAIIALGGRVARVEPVEGRLLELGERGAGRGFPSSSLFVYDGGMEFGDSSGDGEKSTIPLPWTDTGATATAAGRVAAASTGGGLAVWDGERGELSGLVIERPATALALSPGGALLAAVDEDGVVSLWQLPPRRAGGFSAGRGAALRALAFSPDGGSLLTAGDSGVVGLWGLGAEGGDRELGRHEGWVDELALSPAGDLVATAGWDGRVRLAGVADGASLAESARAGLWALAVAISPDGRQVAEGWSDGMVQVWSKDRPEEKLAVLCHAGPVASVRFVADSGRLVSVGWGDSRVVWLDTSTGVEERVREASRLGSNEVAVAADGRAVAVAGRDGRVRLWDGQGEQLRTVAAHRGEVVAIGMDPRSRWLASAGGDGEVRIFDVATGAELVRRPGSRGREVTALAWSGDGNRLALGRADERVSFLELADLASPPAGLAQRLRADYRLEVDGRRRPRNAADGDAAALE